MFSQLNQNTHQIFQFTDAAKLLYTVMGAGYVCSEVQSITRFRTWGRFQL